MLIRTLAFALALSASGAASAQTSPAASPLAMSGGHGAMKACKTDRQTFCAGIEHGGGRIMRCMKDNFAKLSPDCQAAITAMRAAHQANRSEPVH